MNLDDFRQAQYKILYKKYSIQFRINFFTFS